MENIKTEAINITVMDSEKSGILADNSSKEFDIAQRECTNLVSLWKKERKRRVRERLTKISVYKGRGRGTNFNFVYI